MPVCAFEISASGQDGRWDVPEPAAEVGEQGEGAEVGMDVAYVGAVAGDGEEAVGKGEGGLAGMGGGGGGGGGGGDGDAEGTGGREVCGGSGSVCCHFFFISWWVGCCEFIPFQILNESANIRLDIFRAMLSRLRGIYLMPQPTVFTGA